MQGQVAANRLNLGLVQLAAVVYLLVMAQVVVVPQSLRAPTRVGRDIGEAARNWYSKTQWRALDNGEIITVEGDSELNRPRLERLVHAAAVIPHPPEPVWAVLADFEHRPAFLPGAKEIRVIRHEGNRVWLDEHVKVLLVSVRYRVINTLEPQLGAMSWILDKTAPHDIADTEGAWRVTALDAGARTLVTYRVRVETGQPLPGFLENLLVKHSLPDLIEGLRAEVGRRMQLR